jgi:hypothetical protein
MATDEIPRADWLRFLDEFSRRHAGWLVTIEVREPGAGARELAHEVPLSGIAVEERGGEPHEIAIIAGTREGEINHRIPSPTRLLLRRTPEGADEGLEAESAGGLQTTVRFRTAALPETVDGMVSEY